MIRFIIYEDILIYKTKITKIINDLMNHNNFEIIEAKDKKINLNTNDILIYIIDLEKKDSIEFIKKIHRNLSNKTYIICLTQIWEKTQILLQHHFLIHDIIEKYDDYENKINKSINTIISKNYKNKDIIKIPTNDVQIPRVEIKELIILENKIILKAKNIKNENYTHIINGNFKQIKNEIISQFNLENENHLIFFNDTELNLNINLEITTKKNYVKPYKKEKQKNVLNLYKKGINVKKISQLHKVSTSTIYNWIKNDKILKLSDKAERYDKIVEITKK